MHRRQIAPKRVWGAERGTQSEAPPPVTHPPLPFEDLWTSGLLSAPPNIPSMRYLKRPRTFAVEYMDEFMLPASTLYASSRVGSPLLPLTLPSDARRLIADYAPPPLFPGLVPEDRDQFRQLIRLQRTPQGIQPMLSMTQTDDNGSQKVACPQCGRLYPLQSFITSNAEGWIYVQPNYIPPNANPDSTIGRQLIEQNLERQRQLWISHLQNGDVNVNSPGILVCSKACRDNWWHHKRVQNNRRRMEWGETINFYSDPGIETDFESVMALPPNRLRTHEASWPTLTYQDYFGPRELLSNPTDKAVVASRWKRPRFTRDQGT